MSPSPGSSGEHSTHDHVPRAPILQEFKFTGIGELSICRALVYHRAANTGRSAARSQVTSPAQRCICPGPRVSVLSQLIPGLVRCPALPLGAQGGFSPAPRTPLCLHTLSFAGFPWWLCRPCVRPAEPPGQERALDSAHSTCTDRPRWGCGLRRGVWRSWRPARLTLYMLHSPGWLRA